MQTASGRSGRARVFGVGVTLTVAVATLLPFDWGGTANAAVDETVPPSHSDSFDEEGVPREDRDRLLGNGWQDQDDTVNVVLADMDKLDVLTCPGPTTTGPATR